MGKMYIEQLDKLARLKTPGWRFGQANDTYEEVCLKCCQIRNLAKDILAGYEPLNKKNIGKLIKLLLHTNSLHNEVLEEIVR